MWSGLRRNSWVVMILVIAGWLLGGSVRAFGDEKKAAARRRLIIAFASLRERPAFSNLYFYRPDAVGNGELSESVPALHERADSHPALTTDGAVCAYASKQVGGFTPLI